MIKCIKFRLIESVYERYTETATSLTPPSAPKRRLKQYGARRREGCRSAIISHKQTIIKPNLLFLNFGCCISKGSL